MDDLIDVFFGLMDIHENDKYLSTVMYQKQINACEIAYI